MCEQTLSKQTHPQIRVYIANLGKYNEGKIVGAWLNLPSTQSEIKDFLKTKVGVLSRNRVTLLFLGICLLVLNSLCLRVVW
ncbi:MAG: antirestriction protein ArdA [Nitrososphaerota archaeon]|jgi:hypothetical protein|nr:antirestriction protein ArdA [Nitrososphaerota archaeon]